jgi:hypothetical protein
MSGVEKTIILSVLAALAAMVSDEPLLSLPFIIVLAVALAVGFYRLIDDATRQDN